MKHLQLSFTHTNSRGVLYYLCRSTTKTGKSRYYFTRRPKGEPVKEIPQGFKIIESANGLPFLKRDLPEQIRPQEVEAIKAALQRHPKARNYQVKVKHDRIEISEKSGPDEDEILALVGRIAAMTGQQRDQVRTALEQPARFQPVLCFILSNADKRTFRAERWHYSGRGGWAEIHRQGPLKKLARQMIPKLGTEAFFDLY